MQLLDKSLGERVPGNLTAIEHRFVEQLRAVPTQHVELFERGRPREGWELGRAKVGVPLEPPDVFRKMIEEHGIALGHGIVAKPAKFEWQIGLDVRIVK